MLRTTDNQNEIFDVVDENDNVVGQATRGQAHKDKRLIHRSIGVIVFNHQGEMFLQKRSATKDTDPNKWTIACSGHVLSGESYEETVLRELKEELGIILYKGTPCSTARGPLEQVAKYICHAPKETEMVMLYKAELPKEVGPLGRSDLPKGFKLHPIEISQGKFFTRKELIESLEKGKIELSFSGRKALEKVGWI
jgi:isopentenyl-diphosphate delta-isomerase type 1